MWNLVCCRQFVDFSLTQTEQFRKLFDGQGRASRFQCFKHEMDASSYPAKRLQTSVDCHLTMDSLRVESIAWIVQYFSSMAIPL
jgi:hypothetical protein